jgi:hypothetical protein
MPNMLIYNNLTPPPRTFRTRKVTDLSFLFSAEYALFLTLQSEKGADILCHNQK